ncbi:MAG: GNAT family protein [Chloroflexota bacterium]
MIEGKLVRLRAVEPGDAANAYKWINDGDVTRYLMARYPYSLASEQDWVANASKPNDYSEARFAIETKEGVHIGLCGLHRGRPEERTADLGIMIGDKDYHERGFGTDAMLTMIRFGFEQMNLHRVSLGVFDFNQRAQAVYRKVGFVEEGRDRDAYFQDGRYWDVIRMSVLEDEWRALHGTAAIGASVADRANSIASA